MIANQNDGFLTNEESPTQHAINRVQGEFARTGIFHTADLAQILGDPRQSVMVTASDTSQVDVPSSSTSRLR